MALAASDYPKVRIVVEGPGAPFTLVGPVTKTKYGRHKAGDVVWVYAVDAEANPEMFVPAGPEIDSVETKLPMSPEEVRPPAPQPKKSRKTKNVA
jgi:hypothetical protein